MRKLTSVIAALELVLILPAALFMTALVVRELETLPYVPAHTAQRIVLWYSGHAWTLWVLLLALPLAVLVIGCITLAPGWTGDGELPHTARQSLAVIHAHPATFFVAMTTLSAVGILAIVVLHMLAS